MHDEKGVEDVGLALAGHAEPVVGVLAAGPDVSLRYL